MFRADKALALFALAVGLGAMPAWAGPSALSPLRSHTHPRSSHQLKPLTGRLAKSQLQEVIREVQSNLPNGVVFKDLKYKFVRTVETKIGGELDFFIFNIGDTRTATSEETDEKTLKVYQTVTSPIPIKDRIAIVALGLVKEDLASPDGPGSCTSVSSHTLTLKVANLVSGGFAAPYLITIKGNLGNTITSAGSIAFDFGAKGCPSASPSQ